MVFGGLIKLYRTEIIQMSKGEIISSTTLQNTEKLDRKLAELYKFMEKSHPPRAIVKKIYKIVDLITEKVNEQTPFPCQQGCSACCNYAVDVTQVEAVVIAQYYNIEANVKEGIVAEEWGDKKTPLCPFNDLDTGNCQIYELRPLVCRSFASIEESPYPCFTEIGGKHINYTSNPVFMKFLEVLGVMHPQFKGAADIRYFFGENPITINHKKG